MKINIQKVDLDTCLTALILGVSEKDKIMVLRGEASDEVLRNPAAICIEAGGSGQSALNNFDHHNEGGNLPTACQQALMARSDRWVKNLEMDRLVDYVSQLDLDPGQLSPTPFPMLSSVFSGMLLSERNPVTQLLKGIECLQAILDKKIDPFGTMPTLPEWKGWIEAKQKNIASVMDALKKAAYFNTRNGLPAAILESDFIGGVGALYAKGCKVVVLFNPRFGHPPVRKFTIAGNGISVYPVATIFNQIEAGWGGRETIIGSPRGGSHLQMNEVRKLVETHL